MKKEDLSKLSVEDLVSKIANDAEMLNKTKLAHSISAIENPIQLRKVRRGIARMKTELSKRETRN